MSSIGECKKRISSEFLGVAGIHGIGRNDNAIIIYAEDLDAEEFKKIKPEIEAKTSPYKLIVKQSPPAKFA